MPCCGIKGSATRRSRRTSGPRIPSATPLTRRLSRTLPTPSSETSRRPSSWRRSRFAGAGTPTPPAATSAVTPRPMPRVTGSERRSMTPRSTRRRDTGTSKHRAGPDQRRPLPRRRGAHPSGQRTRHSLGRGHRVVVGLRQPRPGSMPLPGRCRRSRPRFARCSRTWVELVLAARARRLAVRAPPRPLRVRR